VLSDESQAYRWAELEGACQLVHTVSQDGGSTEMSLSNYTLQQVASLAVVFLHRFSRAVCTTGS